MKRPCDRATPGVIVPKAPDMRPQQAEVSMKMPTPPVEQQRLSLVVKANPSVALAQIMIRTTVIRLVEQCLAAGEIILTLHGSALVITGIRMPNRPNE